MIKLMKEVLRLLLRRLFFLLSRFPLNLLYKNLGLLAIKNDMKIFAIFFASILCRRQILKRNIVCASIPRHFVNVNTEIRLSVIVPTFNRAKMLPALFDSLARQTLDKKNFEVIIVNNNCTDDTEIVCGEYAHKFTHFRIIHEHLQSLSAARHAGWRAACADILVFCDDDIVALPSWLDTIDAAFSKNIQLGLMGGNNIGLYDSEVPPWFKEFWDQSDSGMRMNVYYSLLEGIESPIFINNHGLVFGCNYSIRRQILEELAGLEPDCMPHVLFQGGGESAPALKIAKNWKALLHPGASVYHRMPSDRFSELYLVRRSFYCAASRMYEMFRAGNFYAFTFVDREKLKSVGINIDAFADVFEAKYIEAVLNFEEFREFITRSSYLGSELPPDNLVAWAQANVPNMSWHCKDDI